MRRARRMKGSELAALEMNVAGRRRKLEHQSTEHLNCQAGNGDSVLKKTVFLSRLMNRDAQ